MSDKWITAQAEIERSEPSQPQRVVFHDVTRSIADPSRAGGTTDVFPRAESADTPFGWIRLAWLQNGLKR